MSVSCRAGEENKNWLWQLFTTVREKRKDAENIYEKLR